MRSPVAVRITNETPDEIRERVREYYDAVIALGKCRTCGTVNVIKSRMTKEEVDKFLERNAYL